MSLKMEAQPVVLYDGVCGLCHRLVQFLLKRDRNNRLRFASLQSEYAAELLRRHNRDPNHLDTVYVVVENGQPDERLLARSDAIIRLFSEIGWPWKIATIGRVLPRVVRDTCYDIVAGNRYRIFGKYDKCMMPDPSYREKFME